MRNQCFVAALLVALFVATAPGPMLAIAAGPGALTITNARVSFDQGTVTIQGENFGDPYVTLNGWTLAVLPGSTADVIVARLPTGLTPDAAGGYRLTVSALHKNGKVKPGAEFYDQLDITIGNAGPDGPKGVSGPVGEIGEAGPAGPAGVPGLSGEPGPAGMPGPKGESGPVGPIGAIGPTGVAGPSGADGAPGATGPMGPRGPIGEQGTESSLGACQNVPTMFDVASGRWATCPAGYPVLRGFYRNSQNLTNGLTMLMCCQIGPGL